MQTSPHRNQQSDSDRGGEALAPSRASQFAVAQEALGICTWIWDVERGTVEWLGDLSPLLGLAPHSFGGHFGEYLERLHPEDRPRSRATYVECLKGLRKSYRCEERIVTPDGTVRWLETYGRARYADDGRALELAGVVRDVTERKEREETHAAVFAASAHPIVISRQEDSVMLEVNDAWCRCMGYAREAAEGRSALELGLWQRPEERAEVVATLALEGVIRNFATRFVRADGRTVEVMLSGVALPLAGEPCIAWSWSDVTELVQARERLDRALRASGVCLWDINIRSGEVYLSEGWAELLGLPPAPTYTTFAALTAQVRPADVERAKRTGVETLKGLRPDYSEEHRVRAANGEWKWILSRGRVVERDPATGRALRMTGTNVDITARKEADAQIEFLANHDALTRLPNRSLLLDLLTHALASAKRERHTLAVLLLGLDRFKNVNDSLGHHIGDSLLNAVAAKLGSALRKGDTLARIGGDEFAILLEDLNSPAAAASIAQKIQDALSESFVIEGHHIAVAASIGIGVHPTDGSCAESLLASADAAMYHAKELGRNNYQYFSRELNARAVARARLELDLRRALFSGELYLEFQPVYALERRDPVGAEALLRWRHPERGRVPPAEFIPVAEEMGIIAQVGDWVLERALRQLAQWHAAGRSDLTMAVNVSPRQLAQGEGFAARVAQLLATHAVPAKCLELEVTENSFAREIEEIPAVLEKLSAQGVHIAIDDFGTGYSSMAYLQRLPFNTLKIDRRFVSRIEHSHNDAVLTRTIIAMARSLGLQVVAEGVETQAQLEILRGMGCDLYQGHFLSRPLAAADFGRRLLAP